MAGPEQAGRGAAGARCPCSGLSVQKVQMCPRMPWWDRDYTKDSAGTDSPSVQPRRLETDRDRPVEAHGGLHPAASCLPSLR